MLEKQLWIKWSLRRPHLSVPVWSKEQLGPAWRLCQSGRKYGSDLLLQKSGWILTSEGLFALRNFIFLKHLSRPPFSLVNISGIKIYCLLNKVCCFIFLLVPWWFSVWHSRDWYPETMTCLSVNTDDKVRSKSKSKIFYKYTSCSGQLVIYF